MNLSFTKMQGLGNDFVVLDFVTNPLNLSNQQFAHIADRRYGIGCDQILIVEKSTQDDIDFKYRIINADGSEVGQCGNGARCLAKFVQQQGLSDKTNLRVATSTTTMQLTINDDDTVTVDMGEVSFAPEQIPFLPLNDQLDELQYSVTLEDQQSIDVSIANIGNPHCLVLVEDIATAPVAKLGSQLEPHPQFPEKVNVGFMQMISPDEVKVRVFERGSGETMACGSGACAAVAMGERLGLLSKKVTVHLTGGDLSIELVDNGHLLMTGSAEFCFTGNIHL